MNVLIVWLSCGSNVLSMQLLQSERKMKSQVNKHHVRVPTNLFIWIMFWLNRNCFFLCFVFAFVWPFSICMLTIKMSNQHEYSTRHTYMNHLNRCYQCLSFSLFILVKIFLNELSSFGESYTFISIYKKKTRGKINGKFKNKFAVVFDLKHTHL